MQHLFPLVLVRQLCRATDIGKVSPKSSPWGWTVTMLGRHDNTMLTGQVLVPMVLVNAVSVRAGWEGQIGMAFSLLLYSLSFYLGCRWNARSMAAILVEQKDGWFSWAANLDCLYSQTFCYAQKSYLHLCHFCWLFSRKAFLLCIHQDGSC